MSKEAMKLALEALEQIDGINTETECVTIDVGNVITALEEALAEQPAQQQEPVVWMYVNKSTHETKFQKHMSDFVDHSLWSEAPLYGEPLANHELQCVCGAVWLGDEMVHLPDKRPPAQQEPVAWKDRTYGNLHHQDFGNSIPLYTSPPASKPWVGLSQQDVDIAFDDTQEGGGFNEFARAIEARLREKNA